jgi:hypothetical protein
MISITDIQRAVATCLQGEHLLRTISIALAVGTWLTLFNQVDVLLTENVGMIMGTKIAVNYLTPFIVSNLGVLSRHQVDQPNSSEPG